MNLSLTNQLKSRLNGVLVCLTGCCLLGLGFPVQAEIAPQPTWQANSATCSDAELSQLNPPYRCITPAIFSCVKRNNTSFGGSLQYRGATEGEIIVKSDLAGPVATLNFKFDEPKQVFNVSVKKKMNAAVSDQQIWAGFKETIMKCRRQS
jgi:hypothetical protein